MLRRVLILAVGLGLVAWLAVWLVRNSEFRTELQAAKRELGTQRLSEARERLVRLAERWPGRGDVQYWLGNCEMAAGHSDGALMAWARVPGGSPEGRLAALASGRLALDKGHFSAAEIGLERAIPGGGEIADEARFLRGRLHWLTGRHDEYRRYLRREVETGHDSAQTLRLLWSIDHDGYPVDEIRRELDRARTAAPDDDRVWLALADLATRTGRFDEASELLGRCEQSRPDDSAVWQARLRWALAANRALELMRAAGHLVATDFSKAEVLELRAWLAARAGDRQAEIGVLQALIADQPGAMAAIDRLASLAVADGRKEALGELRRRKVALNNAFERYRALVQQPELVSQAAELARAAEQIGRRFDARAWWTLAVRSDRSVGQEAETALERIPRTEAMFAPGGKSLAAVIEPAGGVDRMIVAGSLKLSMPSFYDEASTRGLNFTFDNGLSHERQLPETMSGGVGLLDFDGDGWLDVYAIQGGKFPPPAGTAAFGDRLFRNRGDGRFDDVTVASGLAKLPGGYGHGVAVGDYDNDGRPDLFVTRWRSYALYHNAGQGRFEDATAAAGLGGDRDWPTSAAWADLDNDGDLDLYVCHYLKWDEFNPRICEYTGKPEKGNNYCDPRAFPSLPDHFFRNDGGRFVDVTAETGVVDQEGRGLGVIAADFDSDGLTDLFVANDTSANYYLHNRGGFRFSEEGLESGLAASASGGYLAGMGVAYADFEGDGQLDVAVTNFLNESTTLYHNHGGGVFSDRSADSGIAVATRLVLGFGLAALDANNDGYPDMVQVNGHVSDNRPLLPYAMPAQLLLNDGAGRFVDVSDRAGPSWRIPRLGRGLAVGDFDNDGRIDVVIVSENAPLELLHNECSSQNHSLTLLLEGRSSNRDAVAARVAVTAAGRTRVAARFGGGSYQSASDQRLHFGLGTAVATERVEVTWPSGRRITYQGLAADSAYRLREGDSTASPLPCFSAYDRKR
jgi:enediyne biosynthesis protein E4